MALTDLIAFDGLSVITTEMDEIEVAHLLKVNKRLGLRCQDCGGKKFVASGFVSVEMEILSGESAVAITHVDHKKAVINRVTRCAHCHCEDFVTITEPEDNNGQERSSAGEEYVR